MDIALYDKRKIEDLSIFLKDKYIEVAPDLVIEVDTKAALDDLPDPSSYFQKKTDQLLNHGVKKVIWIYTASSKVMIAEKDKVWTMDNWSEDVKIVENIWLNIEEILAAF